MDAGWAKALAGDVTDRFGCGGCLSCGVDVEPRSAGSFPPAPKRVLKGVCGERLFASYPADAPFRAGEPKPPAPGPPNMDGEGRPCPPKMAGLGGADVIGEAMSPSLCERDER